MLEGSFEMKIWSLSSDILHSRSGISKTGIPKLWENKDWRVEKKMFTQISNSNVDKKTSREILYSSMSFFYHVATF